MAALTGHVQLALDLEPHLADMLRDRRKQPSGGAYKLLRELVKRGLSQDALFMAAALVEALDEPRPEARPASETGGLVGRTGREASTSSQFALEQGSRAA